MLHRHARPAVAGSYLFGALCGALLTSTGLMLVGGLLTPIPASWRATIAIATLVLLVGQASGVVCLDLPQRRWQIPQELFHRKPTEAAWRFAAILGTGVRTYITSPAAYAVAIVMVFTPPTSLASTVLAAVLTAVGFGAGRSVIVVVQAGLRSAAVTHSQRWLTAAGWVSLSTCLLIAVRSLAAAT